MVSSIGNLTQTAGILTIGGTSSFTTSASGATITLNSANLLTGAVSLNTNGTGSDAALTNDQATLLGASTVGGNLTVMSTLGNLTQTADVLTVGGTSSFTTSAAGATITLNSANLLTGAVSLNTNGTGSDAALTNDQATLLGASTVGGNLTVMSTLGNLTQTADVLTVGGTSSFTTSAAGATITLNSANLLTGAVSLNTNGTGSDAALTNDQATLLGASTVGGNLTVVSTLGNLTQTADMLTVGGTSSFTTSAAGATITLNSANLLTGAVSLNTNGTGSDAALTNDQATLLGASTVGGNLTVVSTLGNLTQTADVLTVGGTSSFTASMTGAAITLNDANMLTGPVALTTGTSGTAALTNDKATQLGASNVGGNLTVMTTGAGSNLTLDGAVTASGNTVTLTFGRNDRPDERGDHGRDADRQFGWRRDAERREPGDQSRRVQQCDERCVEALPTIRASRQRGL